MGIRTETIFTTDDGRVFNDRAEAEAWDAMIVFINWYNQACSSCKVRAKDSQNRTLTVPPEDIIDWLTSCHDASVMLGPVLHRISTLSDLI